MSLAPPALSDADVVARVLAGETHLFEVLMRRHNQRVFRVTRAILRSDAESEDAMQDAYVQAYTHLAQFEGRSSFVAWLSRIAAHTALARIRRARHEPAPASDALEEEGQAMAARTTDPEDRASSRETVALLEEAIDALPDGFRAVFVLRAVEEMNVAEVAGALGENEETVRTRYFRARALLRASLTRRLDEATRSAYAFHLDRCDRVVAAVLARIT